MSCITDPALCDAIMTDFLQGTHPAHIAANHRISLLDLLDWWKLPAVQAAIARLRDFLEAQRHLTTLAAASECTAILLNVARELPNTESARKAAAQLLRSLGPAAKHEAPRATTKERPTAHTQAHHLNHAAPPAPSDSFPIESFRATVNAESQTTPSSEPRRAPERLACHDS